MSRKNFFGGKAEKVFTLPKKNILYWVYLFQQNLFCVCLLASLLSLLSLVRRSQNKKWKHVALHKVYSAGTFPYQRTAKRGVDQEIGKRKWQGNGMKPWCVVMYRIFFISLGGGTNVAFRGLGRDGNSKKGLSFSDWLRENRRVRFLSVSPCRSCTKKRV